MSFLKNYLFGSSKAPEAAPPAPAPAKKQAVRALPAPWYTSHEMYELEKRAIFSKMWLLITHEKRLQKPGDWILYDMANFEFIVCRDESGAINVFHNFCRHCAGPVVKAEVAENNHSKAFTCESHGYVYNLAGELVTAPGNPYLEGAQAGLLPIHVHIDHKDFIWVNLSGSEQPIPWESELGGVDVQDRFNVFNWDDYEFDHMWSMDAPANWKLSADNYNECYHCKTTHPDLLSRVDLETYRVETEGLVIYHYGNPKQQKEGEGGFRVAPNYYFPNASMNITPHFFFIQKFAPSGPAQTKMIYEVYRNTKSTDEDFKDVDAMYKRVMSEDKALCLAAHKNIEIGAFVNGEMHPQKEQGPIFFQKLARETVQAHYEEEQRAGHQIWPAQRTPVVADTYTAHNQLTSEVADASGFGTALPVSVAV